MLLSTHLNKLDSKVDSIVNALSEEQGQLTRDLYARLTLKLNEISESLEQDVRKAIKHINNSYLADKEDFRENINFYLRDKVISLEIKNNTTLQDKMNRIQEVLTQNLTTSIQNEVLKQLDNINAIISIDELIDKIKTPELIQTIVTTCIDRTTKELQSQQTHIIDTAQQNLLYILQQNIQLEDVVIKALESEELKNNLYELIKQEANKLIQETLTPIINTESFNQSIDTLLQELQNTTQQELNNTIQEITTNFNEDLQSQKESIITDAINMLKENLESQISLDSIHHNIVLQSMIKLEEYQTAIKEAIVNQTTNLLVSKIPNTEIQQAILQSEVIQQSINTQVTELTHNALTHATLKDFIAEVLQTKAKDILIHDEMLRYNAEGQALLVSMRLQSQLANIQEELDNIVIDSKLQELQNAMSEAKKELMEELKQAAQGIIPNQNNTQQAITQLQQDLNTIKQDIQDMQNMQNTQKPNVNSGNNKYLVWS